MKRILACTLALCLLIGATITTKAYMPKEKFQWLLEHKIVEGRGDGDLDLGATITREEMAKIIVVAKEKLGPIQHQKTYGKQTFSDVPKNTWSYHFVELAALNGWIQGRGDGKFYPKDNVTVQEVLAIVSRAVLDSGNLEWPNGYLDLAEEKGLLKDITTAADQDATRQDAFLILLHAVQPGEDITVVDEKETHAFTDDTGRRVELPKSVERIGAAGNPASFFLYTFAPEKLVGWSKNPKGDQAEYYLPEVRNLTQWGSFYGAKSTLNKEELIKVNPELIVDFGQAKGNIKEDMNNIQKDTNVPIVFIKGDLEDTRSAYEKLGKILHMEDRAKELIAFIDEVMAIADKAKAAPEKTYYVGDGDAGLNTNHAGNVQAAAFERVGLKNVIQLDDKSDRGGNEVSIEELVKQDPEIIFLYSNSIFETIKDLPIWSSLQAVKNNQVYEIPSAGFNWIGRPSGVNNILGILFAARVKAPQVLSEGELKEMMIRYYELFMHYGMSQGEADAILKRAFSFR